MRSTMGLEHSVGCARHRILRKRMRYFSFDFRITHDDSLRVRSFLEYELLLKGAVAKRLRIFLFRTLQGFLKPISRILSVNSSSETHRRNRYISVHSSIRAISISHHDSMISSGMSSSMDSSSGTISPLVASPAVLVHGCDSKMRASRSEGRSRVPISRVLSRKLRHTGVDSMRLSS